MTADPIFSHEQQRFCGGWWMRRIKRVELCQPVGRQVFAGLEQKVLPALTMKCCHLICGERSQCAAFSNWLMSVVVASVRSQEAQLGERGSPVVSATIASSKPSTNQALGQRSQCENDPPSRRHRPPSDRLRRLAKGPVVPASYRGSSCRKYR